MCLDVHLIIATGSARYPRMATSHSVITGGPKRASYNDSHNRLEPSKVAKQTLQPHPLRPFPTLIVTKLNDESTLCCQAKELMGFVLQSTVYDTATKGRLCFCL